MDTILVKDVKNRVTVSVAEKGATGPAGPQGQSANLVPATNATLGGIIVGDNLSITGNGVLSVANTFQPKTSCVTYGLTDTLLPNGPNTFYVVGEHVVQSGKNFYTGLRGRKTSAGVYQNATFYGVGGYTVDSNGTPTALSTLETSPTGLLLSSSNLTTSSLASTILVNSAGYLTLTSSNGSSAGSCSLSLQNGALNVIAGNTGFMQIAGNNNPLGPGFTDYTFSVAGSSDFTKGVSIQRRTTTSSLAFPYIVSNGTGTFDFSSGFSFYDGDPLSAATEFQHKYTNLSSNVASSTTIRLVRNNAELSYAEMIQVKTSNSILTKGYADSRYATLAQISGLMDVDSSLIININDLDIRLTDLEPLVSLKLPSANFTYANLTGTPDLTAYVKKTQNTTQTIASTATVGGDSSTLTLNSSSYAMSVSTLAGISNLTVTPTSATLDLAGNGTWTANSILTMGYADGRYLTSANLTYANITGKPTLANVATSGSYTDLSNTPTAYSLPTATNTTLGGIKVGANLSISNGVLSAISSGSSATSLPWANITFTPLTLAGYGINDGLTTTDAAATYVTFSEANNAFAAKTVAINPGTGLTGGGNLALSRTLSLANTTVTAGSYGSSSLVPVLTVDAQGRLTSVTTAAVSGYTLPAATTSTLGGVRLGVGVGLDANGFLTTDVKLTTNTFTGTQNLQDNELIRAKIRDYSETVSSPTISAGTLTLNLETSNIFTVSLNAAITTLTISNPPASGSGGSFTLIFTADGTPRSVNWTLSSGVIKWAGGTAPTITSAIGKVDSFAFFTSDGGTTWQGYIGGQNF